MFLSVLIELQLRVLVSANDQDVLPQTLATMPGFHECTVLYPKVSSFKMGAKFIRLIPEEKSGTCEVSERQFR